MDTLNLGDASGGGVLRGRPSRYSPECREQAVELVRGAGKTIAEVARDLSINDTTLGNWVEADNAERAELTRLRRENAKLKVEREILKKAAAFFVTESTR